MKRGSKKEIFILLFLVSIILVSSFASAFSIQGFFLRIRDFFTGKVTEGGCTDTDTGIKLDINGTCTDNSLMNLTKTINIGESTTVDIDGKNYKVTIPTIEQITGVNYATIFVDDGFSQNIGGTIVSAGESARLSEGSTKKIGDLSIYVKAISYFDYAELVIKGAGTYYDACIYSATGNHRLKEYFCSQNTCQFQFSKCEDSGFSDCSNGACIQQNVTTCTDTDGGNNLNAKGTVVDKGTSYNDYCSSSTSIVEYYCSGGSLAMFGGACPSGTVCSNGACVQQASQPDLIVESISIGSIDGRTSGNVSNPKVGEIIRPIIKIKNIGTSPVSSSFCGTFFREDGGTWTTMWTGFCSSTSQYIYPNQVPVSYLAAGDTVSFYGAGAMLLSSGNQRLKVAIDINNNVAESNENNNELITTIAVASVQTCTAGLKCKDAGTLGYQNSDCSWTSITYCSALATLGCVNGSCVPRCTDSDGGKNYYVKGTGTGIYDYTSASDPQYIYGQEPDLWVPKPSPYSYSIFYDYCASSTQLNEAYCTSGGKLGSYGYICPNGCLNGVCKSQTCTASNICTDTVTLHSVYTNCSSADKFCPYGCSNGACLSDTGTVKYSKRIRYNCNAPDTNNWCPSCEGWTYTIIGPTADNYAGCPSSCSNMQTFNYDDHTNWHICKYTKTPTQTCTDSDGGRNYETYGYTDVKATGTSTVTDYCITDTILGERFCEGSESKLNQYTCPNGCSDGVCKKSSGNDNTTGVVCIDSDGGIDYFKYGTVKHSNGALTSSDYCLSTITLKELYCSNGYFSYKEYQCPNGCNNGACLNQTVFIQKCIIATGSGLYCYDFSASTSGITIRLKNLLGNSITLSSVSIIAIGETCISNTNPTVILPDGTADVTVLCSTLSPGDKVQGDLTISFIDSTGGSIQTTGQFAAIVQGIPIPTTCTDSDGGKDYSVKGSVSVKGTTQNDSCGTNFAGTLSFLSEVYCDSTTTGGWNHISVVCTEGCLDGKCINGKYRYPTCSDSDGGNNIYTKGTVETEGGGGGTDCCSITYAGSCYDLNTSQQYKEGSYVWEQACNEEGQTRGYNYYCPNGCLDGACIQQNVTTCAVGWKCQNVVTKAYQNADCSWTSITNCPYECRDGSCVTCHTECHQQQVGQDCHEECTRSGWGRRCSTVCVPIYSSICQYVCENVTVEPLPTANNYPYPFIQGAFADVAIVIGAIASTMDVINGVDIASNLQIELSKNGGGSLGSIAVMDSEISNATSKNLIVIGSPCINKVAAKLLGSDNPLCGKDITAVACISRGQFLIQSFASPYNFNKIALLVMGYEDADTRNATSYLITNKPSTKMGTIIAKDSNSYTDVLGGYPCKTIVIEKTCVQLGGIVCDANSRCSMQSIAASDTKQCCLGECRSVTQLSCFDGVQNGDELGVDCGGSCPACKEEGKICNGCSYKDKCLPFGIRVEGKYCTLSNGLEQQKDKEESCENNFECKSNLCIDGKCIAKGFFQRIMEWFKRLFGGE